MELLYFEFKEKGSAKINRTWNGILQSITTFPSAGGGVIEKMCQDFCRKRKKNVDKHKRKVHFTEGYLEKGGAEKNPYMPLKLSPVSQSLRHYLLIVFTLAQGTKYLRKASEQKSFYPCTDSVYKAEEQSDSHCFKKFPSLILMYDTQPSQ